MRNLLVAFCTIIIFTTECTIHKTPAPSSGVIIIPGITGDLAKRKLIPAVYNLVADGAQLFIIGTGRKEQDTAKILEQFRPFISNLQEKTFTQLKNKFAYKQLDGDNPKDFKAIDIFVKEIVQEHKLGKSRIMFLSLPPESFARYTQHSVAAGLIESHNPQHRVVYEKPFGTDSTSAQAINNSITTHLAEEQIYRIDHYLAKPLVHAIPSLRRDNPLLAMAWNNCMIESVHISLHETLDMQGRGSFYDSLGLVNDVIQNHALQLVALIAMEHPAVSYKEQAQRKTNVLQHIFIKDGFLGQYTGYRAEKGVAPDSKTETYAALTLCCDVPQWKGVPFYISAGKALAEKKTEIIINFKGGNKLILKIAPQEEIVLPVQLKNVFQQTTPINLIGSTKSLGNVDAYQLLLFQVLNGQKDATVSMPEIVQQWRIAESIKKRKLPLCEYKQGAQESEIMHSGKKK